MVSMAAFGQITNTAIMYQRNHQISMKAAELANTLLLSPGDPVGWGQSDDIPFAFGLQDAERAGYSLDAFSLSRLSYSQPLVYYNKTGLWYSNNSLTGGIGALLVPVTEVVNYTTASRLLGVEESYAFRLTITPTLNVSLLELSLNPLRIEVDVRGLRGAVSDATLNYFLYHAVPGGGQYPSFEALSGTSRTDITGYAILEFPSVDGSQFAYSIIVYARVGGLSGVGYQGRDSITNNKVIPFIEDFQNRVVLLAHSWDVHNFGPPVAALHFNATFFSLTQDFQLHEIQMVDSGGFVRHGLVNYGETYEYVRAQIPSQTAGILIVAYRWGNSFGIVMMPWGIGVLGFSAMYGGDPSAADWVAVELRQVTINKMSYQAKVAVWKTSYQTVRYNP
jgi:hypothetical protein